MIWKERFVHKVNNAVNTGKGVRYHLFDAVDVACFLKGSSHVHDTTAWRFIHKK
jgi:hypothetical protein